MNIIDILLAAAVGMAVLAAATHIWRNRGKACGGNCVSCGCSCCQKKE